MQRHWGGNTRCRMEFNKHISEDMNLWRETVGIKMYIGGLLRRVLNSDLGS